MRSIPAMVETMAAVLSLAVFVVVVVAAQYNNDGADSSCTMGVPFLPILTVPNGPPSFASKLSTQASPWKRITSAMTVIPTKVLVRQWIFYF